MSSPLPYCRTNQTSSDIGVIGMITASARHRWTYRRRNGTKRKFFNDFSRACARVRASQGAFEVSHMRSFLSAVSSSRILVTVGIVISIASSVATIPPAALRR
jgi:hypothetical protein